MKKQKTPQEKKALAYDKDHVLLAESVQAQRKNYPRIKARASRNERREVRHLLTGLATTATEDQIGDFPAKPVRRKRVRKWCAVVPLGKIVKMDQMNRLSRLTWSFFKQEYDTAKHRDAFSEHLEYLTTSVPEYASEIAYSFGEALHWITPTGQYVYGGLRLTQGKVGQWLNAFFDDKPEWKTRLQNWISNVLSKGYPEMRQIHWKF